MGWVHQDQSFFYGLLKAVVQQGMDAVDHPDAQALVLRLDVGVSLDFSVFLEVVVELLNLDGA